MLIPNFYYTFFDTFLFVFLCLMESESWPSLFKFFVYFYCVLAGMKIEKSENVHEMLKNWLKWLTKSNLNAVLWWLLCRLDTFFRIFSC